MVSALTIVLLSALSFVLAGELAHAADNNSSNIDEDEFADMVLQLFATYNIKVNNKEKILEGIQNMSSKEDVLKSVSFIRNAIKALTQENY